MKIRELIEGKIKQFVIDNPTAKELPRVTQKAPETPNHSSIDTTITKLAMKSRRPVEDVRAIYDQLKAAHHPNSHQDYAILISTLKRQLRID
jgi:hypothetical protein